MKILNWMQNKLNGRKKPNSVSAPNTNHMQQAACREEFSDWPQAILAIGTFGNNNKKQELGKINNNIAKHDSLSSQELTPEEAKNLQNELNSYFREESNLATEEEQDRNDRFNCEDSSLELETKENDSFSEWSINGNSAHFYPNSNLIPIRAKDLCLDDNNKNVFGKKSLSFLLKKFFVCSSGFQPTPSFKDPLISTESRMEKMLRTILQKKIYHQGSNSKMYVKKYLENINMAKSTHDIDIDIADELNAAVNKKGTKWVKTDSEYIVLEI